VWRSQRSSWASEITNPSTKPHNAQDLNPQHHSEIFISRTDRELSALFKPEFSTIIYKNSSLEKKHYTNNCGFSVTPRYLASGHNPYLGYMLRAESSFQTLLDKSLEGVKTHKNTIQISIAVKLKCRDYRLPPRCRRYLRSSVMFSSAE
jgi:hypothetical protein